MACVIELVDGFLRAISLLIFVTGPRQLHVGRIGMTVGAQVALPGSPFPATRLVPVLYHRRTRPDVAHLIGRMTLFTTG